MKFRLRLLLVAFAVSFLLVGILSVVSISRFSRLSSRVNAVEHSYEVSNLINTLDEQVRELDKNEFRYLVSADNRFLREFEAAFHRIRKISDSLKALTLDNPAQQGHIVLFNSDMMLFNIAARNAMRANLPPDSIHASLPYQNSRTLLDTAEKRLDHMVTEQARFLKKRTAERVAYQQRTSDMTTALSVVFGILTLILFFLLLQELRKRLLYQTELQQKMTEVARSKQELEHIAYATSHDLQEPLRKIRILTDKWKHGQRHNPMTEETRDTLNRIVGAATRMQELVSELMLLTTLNEGEQPVRCPLHDYVDHALESFSMQIYEKHARIEQEELPVVQGHPEQLRLLFRNLLDNALKFTRPGITPIVSISARKADGSELGQEIDTGQQYYCITIQDNGVGFDTKMADKMFGIFRQLHSAEDGNTGKGAGLAICQRIMSNHKGHIVAHGFPDAGATFKLYFPVPG
jgi:signal transduction histidine kinase